MTELAIIGQFALAGFALSGLLYLARFETHVLAQKGDTSGQDENGKQQSLRTQLKYNRWDLLPFFTLVAATICITFAFSLAASEGATWHTGTFFLVSVLGWLTIFSGLKLRIPYVAVLVAPLATLILLADFFTMPRTDLAILAKPTVGSLQHAIGLVHMALSVVGQGFAVIAAAIATIYLWRQRRIKSKSLTTVGPTQRWWPALDAIEKTLAWSLWIGFTFITLGLVTGAIYAQRYIEILPVGLMLKVVWAIGVWLFYLSVLMMRRVFGRTGKQLARLSLFGFALLLVAFFGLAFFYNTSIAPGGA